LSRRADRRRRGCLLLAGALVAAPQAASGFAVLLDEQIVVHELVREAARWDAGTSIPRGLAGGLQVAIDPSVANDLAVEPEDVATLEQAIENAFAMWESGVIRFEIEHDSPLAQRDPESGLEIDVFAVPASDPAFVGLEAFGRTFVEFEFEDDRLLTNGRTVRGFRILGADIFLNTTRLLETQEQYGLPAGIAAFALTRLLAYEVGHALGLHHPNEQRNIDYDFDPLDVELVAPADPFTGLLASQAFDGGAIMSNKPCGPVLTPCNALFYQALRPDDRLGRDVLYGVPVPEPASPWLAVAAFGALAVESSARRVGARRGENSPLANA
jgi:hypothetical protein